MKRLLSICLFCTAAASSHAAVSELSRASENLGAASGFVLLGSMSMLAASGQVIVTGVEAVAELNDFVRAAATSFRNVRPEEIRVVLLHSGGLILPELPKNLAAVERVRMRGIDVPVLLPQEAEFDGSLRGSGERRACVPAKAGERHHLEFPEACALSAPVHARRLCFAASVLEELRPDHRVVIFRRRRR